MTDGLDRGDAWNQGLPMPLERLCKAHEGEGRPREVLPEGS